MEELIPLGFGLLLGALLGVLRPSLRPPLGAALAALLGALATFVTGESEISWSFIQIDIPLVAVSAALGLLAGRTLGSTLGAER